MGKLEQSRALENMSIDEILLQVQLSDKDSNVWRDAFMADNQKVFEALAVYFSKLEVVGFGKQNNRGKMAEMWLQANLGLIPDFNKIDSWDFIYQGMRVQFKYLGQNSAPSASEYKRLDGESITKFVNRIMKFYKDCDMYVISFDNFISNIKWEKCYKLTSDQFKKVLRAHDKNVKDGNKMRLRKTVVRRTLDEMGLL